MMGIFTPRPDQWEKLKAIGSSPMYTWSDHQCKALIQDSTTKKVWAMGQGTTAQSALDDALKNAVGRKAPQTTAEMAMENLTHADQITHLESKLDDLKKGPGASKPARFMEDSSIDSGRKTKKKRRRRSTSEIGTDTDTE
jgi:hypothetical protein